MKVFERIIEQEIRKVIDISNMQFGFMPGKGAIDAFFIARQLQGNTFGKRKIFTSLLLIWRKPSIEYLGTL